MAGRPTRRLLAEQSSQLTLINRDGTHRTVVYETHELIEAPNWSPDGEWLVYNGGGKLYRLRLGGSGDLETIDIGVIDSANNDHLISPNGQTIYFSADGSLYAVPFGGGVPRKISNDYPTETPLRCFLHGVSPDGSTLSYVGITSQDFQGARAIYTIPAAGGVDTKLTHTPRPVDGPEFSPDGRWIYFNSELQDSAPGHAQILRMRIDASHTEQLTFDTRVNWFPHVSPDGRWVSYLSYPPGTRGHPTDLEVILRCMRADGGEATDVVSLLGGQGTLNVNSWAPDSTRFAYVAYPVARA